jgi:hypothetical protein
MAVTVYIYDYDFGPNYLRVAIMNIGSVDPNFTGVEHWRAGNAQQLDLEYLVHTSGIFLPPKRQNQNSRTTFWCCYL